MLSITRNTVNKMISKNAIGVNQTLQDVTASRNLGITYTNTTGKPIYISISVAASGVVSVLTVDSLIVSRIGTSQGDRSAHTAVIPNGSTYNVTTGVLEQWHELR